MGSGTPATAVLVAFGCCLIGLSAAARGADPQVGPPAIEAAPGLPLQPVEPILPSTAPSSPPARLPAETKADPLNDQDLKASIEAALAGDPYLAEVPLEVGVQSRTVFLVGSVDERFLRDWAEDAVKAVPGVRAVRNHLVLSYVPPRKRDWEIEDEIRWRLGFSPIVDARQIGVRVEDGVAYLTGTVDTLQERNVAARQAAQVATRMVTDALVVQHRVPILRVPTCPSAVDLPGPECPPPSLQIPGGLVK